MAENNEDVDEQLSAAFAEDHIIVTILAQHVARIAPERTPELVSALEHWRSKYQEKGWEHPKFDDVIAALSE